MINPQRGEIWLVDLSPTRGQEIQKTRPVVVINTNLFSPIPLRIIIPITSWQEKFNTRPFMLKIDAAHDNKLIQNSAANILQITSISTERFIKKIGIISDNTIKQILALLLICTEFEP